MCMLWLKVFSIQGLRWRGNLHRLTPNVKQYPTKSVWANTRCDRKNDIGGAHSTAITSRSISQAPKPLLAYSILVTPPIRLPFRPITSSSISGISSMLNRYPFNIRIFLCGLFLGLPWNPKTQQAKSGPSYISGCRSKFISALALLGILPEPLSKGVL